MLVTTIKSILANKGLSTYHKMVLIIIRTHEAEHNSVFPSYDTIASQGSMSKRKAQYVVKELVEQGYLEKEHRFSIINGETKQLSNEYIATKENAQHAQTNDLLHAQYAPYKSSSKSFKDLNLEEEDININLQQEIERYPQYAEIVKQMIKHNDVLTWNDIEFLDSCKRFNIPSLLALVLYKAIKQKTGNYHFDAISSAIERFTERYKAGKIFNPITWFETTIFNESLRHRSISQLN